MSYRTHTLPSIKLLGLLFGCLISCLLFLPSTTHGLNYSAGSYGACQYSSCSIGLTSSGTVNDNVTPVGSATTCTVSNDLVTATTDSSTGYTVTITDPDTSNALTRSPSGTIPAIGGTAASPTVLTANTWGYRVDSVAGFGAGPTAAITNGASTSLGFAAVPLSTDTAGLIRTTTTADTSAVNTSVWFGVCANATIPNGAYGDNVTYTAVTN